MSLSFRFLIKQVLFLSLSAVFLQAAPATAGVEKAWENAATFGSNEAYVEFTRAEGAKSGDPREITLGRATTLLGVQPRTTGNIDEAATLCQKLIQENPGDRVGLLATYLSARIEEFHRQPPNLKKAEEIYRQLLQEHPESPTAQLSASKLATLLLFNPEASRDQQLKVLGELDSILPQVTLPSARRDMLFVMGNGCIMLKLSDEKALAYLIEAEALGISSSKLRADTLVQIGLIAQSLNRRDVSLKYFSKFVDAFKRDGRNYLIQEKMAALKSGS